eukprot:CAMPEP_0168343350 /NCGR_PEP_ID=MMETSP0213-20121227/16026_1 /TAXON_ID=151035 /ORGANISM="Euplotes harpa, Strain FSP1.4" /LENGTH=140 /DNA_ID=CAMNT_0008350599 /DNA_START=18 /DNA_END=440 /DNA_ORIENTATION=+
MSVTNQQEFQQKLDRDLSEIKKIQIEMQKLMQAKQALAEKKHENELVQSEFNLMDETAVVFKLVGPILAKQDVAEAKSNVEKRLEYLEKEIARVSTLMKDFEKKMEDKRLSIMKIQESYKKAVAMAQAQAQSPTPNQKVI